MRRPYFTSTCTPQPGFPDCVGDPHPGPRFTCGLFSWLCDLSRVSARPTAQGSCFRQLVRLQRPSSNRSTPVAMCSPGTCDSCIFVVLYVGGLAKSVTTKPASCLPSNSCQAGNSAFFQGLRAYQGINGTSCDAYPAPFALKFMPSS